ncbi:hypothetical protein H6P81_007135 [Aristolochia fimbriata]|uniref:Uncharacterized protein n=1 Tax=Aristolochia fimbriata TaxID=158543 RepID=A0AAV7F312_ARIFI|nr:hypothetical protein H6P81_007135 [Aristolochia fimbriata]
MSAANAPIIMKLRDVSYLKRDELLRIYIAKATGIVAAYGFPEVVGERYDPDIHFMYIEGAAKTGQIKDVKRSYPLPCMPTTCFDILKDMGKKAAREYPQQLGVDACIRLFEQFKSYEGSYFLLGTYLSSRLDPDIHFKYIEGSAKTGQIEYVKRAANEYSQQLGVDACIRLFEQFKSYEGSYFLLGTYLSSRLDSDIHFKYIEGSSKTGQIEYVKRVTKESKFYDPEKTKNLLMKAKLLDARPLMNVCGRFGFVPDLTHYHVNPGNAPLVVVQLLDDECPEDFIKVLLYLSVLSFQRILLWSNVRRG